MRALKRLIRWFVGVPCSVANETPKEGEFVAVPTYWREVKA